MNHSEKYGLFRDKIENALARYFEAEGIPRALRNAMAYSAGSGGKRLRPILLLAANELMQGDEAEALPFACAVEMIHNYSLVHDDLPAMDNDDFRRGQPACHRKFGEWLAILAGDGLLSYAFEIMLSETAKAGKERSGALVKAALAIARGAGVSGMVGGQCADMENENALDLEKLYYIHERKTGALIRASLEAGLLLCSPDDERLKAIRRYGECIGLAFQITDDLLDISEDAGKPTRSDEKNVKLTFPKVYGVEGAVDIARAKVEEAIAALGIFGDRNGFLVQLANAILTRKS
ncbi:MAG: polyprenyl synthetase family protein [Bacillota bacterium]|nr:polyprenyl synthetase family protein [Bacillota bacterium]